MTSTINESLFRQSELDDYPLKRDDKHTNKIIQPEFSPLNSENSILLEISFEMDSKTPNSLLL